MTVRTQVKLDPAESPDGLVSLNHCQSPGAVCACVLMCVPACTHLHVCAHVYVCCICEHVYECMCLYACVFVCNCMCMYVYLSLCVCLCVHGGELCVNVCVSWV